MCGQQAPGCDTCISPGYVQTLLPFLLPALHADQATLYMNMCVNSMNCSMPCALRAEPRRVACLAAGHVALEAQQRALEACAHVEARRVLARRVQAHGRAHLLPVPPSSHRRMPAALLRGPGEVLHQAAALLHYCVTPSPSCWTPRQPNPADPPTAHSCRPASATQEHASPPPGTQAWCAATCLAPRLRREATADAAGHGTSALATLFVLHAMQHVTKPSHDMPGPLGHWFCMQTEI
jgi:hypothetical protein